MRTSLQSTLCVVLVSLLPAAVALAGGGASTEAAGLSPTQPGASLLMPLDARPDRASYLLVSRVGEPPPAARDDLLGTHWVFWDDGSSPLARRWLCLRADETVVVDPLALPEGAGGAVGPSSLAGRRGLVTVTAYEDASACGASGSPRLADETIAGAFVLADVPTNASYGQDALAFGVDETGTFIDLPRPPTAAEGTLPVIDLQSYAPASVAESTLVLMAIAERRGAEGFAGELGPLAGVRVRASFHPNDGATRSLGSFAFDHVLIESVRERLTGTDGSAGGATSGFVRLEDVRVGTEAEDGRDETNGDDPFVAAILGQALGPFGIGSSGRSHLARAPTPSPRASATPRPSATPTPRRTGPGPSTTPIGSPTPPGPTPATTPPLATPSPRPGGTPVAGTPTPLVIGSPTPVSSTPSPSPSPVAGPTPTLAAIACNSAVVSVGGAWSGVAPAAGVFVRLPYPAASLLLPGTGADASVRARIEDVAAPAADLLRWNDHDGSLLVALAWSGSAAQGGALLRIRFDCAAGRLPPGLELQCELDAGSRDGESLRPSTCTATIQVE